ncbi:MAG: RagB/SusD family nutrient uptake outer membrane protein [Bacteroidales bacterium]|jgi:hypothetical protein|nr:RagB/SusD family nutrient uptake outer membrane protein [Bacteroidales bacterium]
MKKLTVNIKKIRNAACYALLTVSFVSCEDFLQEEPKGQLMPEAFFSSKNDIDMALYALYKTAAESTQEHDFVMNAWAGDDLGTHPASNKAEIREFDRYNVSPNSKWMGNTWQQKWGLVRAANFVINGVEKTPGVDPAYIGTALAQASYWRAYAYFYLVQCWGPLPKLTENKVDYNAPLVPVEEIFDLIVADLKIAEEAPARYETAPWGMNGYNVAVGQAAAKATLAYVYMSMAGWPLNKIEYYALAAAKAKEVIDGVENGTYRNALLDEYWKIHSWEYNNKNTEVLLAHYYSLDWGWGQCNVSAVSEVLQDVGDYGWGDSCGEISFWKNFPEGPRKEATYAPKTLRPSDNTLQDWWWDTDPPSRPVVNPWFIKAAEGPRGAEFDYRKGANQGRSNGWGEKSHHIVRLSEVYCWYAEALGRAGQTNAKAIELLNAVRNRADGATTNVYPAGMAPTALAEAAYNEHGWEIAGYNWGSIATRYFDMFRMNRVAAHFEARKQNLPIEVAPGVWRKEAVTVEGAWSDDKMYAPYPAFDSLLNPNLN